jgi:hypothetical protein
MNTRKHGKKSIQKHFSKLSKDTCTAMAGETHEQGKKKEEDGKKRKSEKEEKK